MDGADRGRWSRKGATRTPASRQPKLHGPDALAGASLGTHGGGVVRRLPSARCCRWSPSGGEAPAPEREGSLKSNGHRGSCGAGFKHRARDAREMADLRSYRRRLSAARRSGPRVRQDPGVPRRPHFSSGAATRKTRAQTRRGKEKVCLECEESATRSNTLPWRGRVGEQRSCETGWGGDCEEVSPHPAARFTRVDPPPPGEGQHRARGASVANLCFVQ